MCMRENTEIPKKMLKRLRKKDIYLSPDVNAVCADGVILGWQPTMDSWWYYAYTCVYIILSYIIIISISIIIVVYYVY